MKVKVLGSLPTIWSNETLRATENALVAAGLVKRYDYLVKSRGQTIDIPNVSNAFTARSKTQGSDVTDDAVTETQTQIQINKWFYNSFIIEDILAVQSNYDLNKLGSFYSNVEKKFLKLRETPFGTIRSETRKGTLNDYNRISSNGKRDSLNSTAMWRN